MTFTTILFLPMILILIVALYLCKRENTRQILVLIFSLAFYSLWGIYPLLILLVCAGVSIVFGHIIIKALQNGRGGYCSSSIYNSVSNPSVVVVLF